jgi:phage tail-like protein
MVEGLESPHPIGLQLPGLFHDDDFSQRFCAALDEVLSPIFLTLDAVEAYVDPWLAPDDFLMWLSEWLGIEIEEDLAEDRKRAMVAAAADLQGWAGTARGIADLVEAYTGVRPEVVDSGGASWSPVPGGDLPGSPDMTLRVTLRVASPEAVDAGRLDRILRQSIPAHVVTTVEIVQA